MRAQLQQLSHRWHAHCHYITNGWRNCSLGGRQTTIGGIYRAGDQEEDNSNPLFNWCTSSAAFPQGCSYRSAGIWSHMDLLCSSRALRLSFRSCSSNCKTRLFIGRFSQELEFTICDGELFKHKQKQKLIIWELLRLIIMTHGYRTCFIHGCIITTHQIWVTMHPKTLYFTSGYIKSCKLNVCLQNFPESLWTWTCLVIKHFSNNMFFQPLTI